MSRPAYPFRPAAPKVHKGVYYFRTFEDARDYALGRGYPTNRIIKYGRGWAIQAEPGGDYAGPHGLKFSPVKVQS